MSYIIKNEFCDNYFPPSVIEVRNYNYSEETIVVNSTEYRYPQDFKYDNNVVGVFKVKHKILNPDYYCEGQKHLIN